MADLFSGLEPFKLTQVQLTDRVLGCGSYATVYEVIYDGKKCAGKEIHKLLQEQGNTSYTLRRFEEECHILSCLHHPNIVQFYGVYFREKKRVPILIMEFLPMNLTSCIEERGILPEEISYSILHGVALGLHYLHHQDPPIIHRDLSANNVLLTYDMDAKISDFGVARMLNLTPLHVSRLTQTPGTPAYMPPEVMVANPVYNTSVDEFSFGIMMIHIFSGKWPEPQCSPIRMEDGKMIPVSEAERRDIFLQVIGYDHPLMRLILKCISNDPQQRVHIDGILEQISVGEKKVISKAHKADPSNSILLKGVEQSSGDKETRDEETTDESTDNHRRIHQESSEKQDQQETKCLAANSGRTSPASEESEHDTVCIAVILEKQSKQEEGGIVDFYQPIHEPTHSKGTSTSAIFEGFSHLKDDFMALKVALTPKLHQLREFITHAATSQQQNSDLSMCDSSADREIQTVATANTLISTDQEEQKRRLHTIQAVEEDDVVVVTMSPPQAKKHHESKMTNKQSLSATSSRSTYLVEQLYPFDEDFPSLTGTQPQEAEQGPKVPVQHYEITSSQDPKHDGIVEATSSTQAKEHSEIKEGMTLSITSSRSRSLEAQQGTIVPAKHQEMTSSHDVGDEWICSTSTRGLSVSEFTEISPKQNVDDYYEESTPSDNGVEESLFGADWYRLCGNLVQHSQQQKQAIESPPPSPVYDPDDSVAERTEQSSSANIWVPVSLPDHIQHNLQCVCLSNELLWVVDSTGSVYCVIMEPPLSRDQPWKNIKGYLHQISSSSSGNNVWGVHDHNTYVRLGIGLYPEGTQWKNVTSNTHYANRIRQIAVDESAVWAVSTDGKVLFRSDVGQAYPEGKTWQEVRNDSESPQITFKFVACCHNVVWAVTTSGQVLCRTGIAYHMPSGRQWKEVKVPKLVSISITSEGVVWGVSENNVIGFRCGASTSKPSGKGPWWEVCIDVLGTTPVVSHTIIDRLMDNLSFMEENHFISISASSKSGVVVLDEKGRRLHACWTTVIGFYYTPASSNDLFQSMGWNKIAAGGTALWLTTAIDGDLYSLASEDMTHIECPVKIDQVAASASCMWVMSEDSIWSRQMLSTKVPEGIAFDRIELSAELQCAQLCHIACGKNSAWAVDINGVPHFQFTVQSQEPGAMSPAWIPLEDNPHPLKMITVSPNDCLVWACDEHHNVYARIGITPNSPVGQKWELIPGEQAKELCAENTKIYALTQNSELICRHGITENNVQGYYWRKMPGRFEHITVGETGDLWTVDARGKVWKQEQIVVTVASPLVVEPRELEMTFSGEMNTSVTSDQSDWEVV